MKTIRPAPFASAPWWLLLLASLSLAPSFQAQTSTAPTVVPLSVNRTTGAIVGPVDAATFSSANSLGGGGGGGSGDFSSNTSSSIDGEILLFSGTGGKTGKRATGSGLVKVTSGVFGTATSGTDYAPATSGTSLLKGNGSGGFSNAASGTDYAPATSGSGILKGNGSGGFTTATAGTDYVTPSALGATNGSGPNAGDGLVHWSQLIGVPAGFADGTDDGAGGGSGDFSSNTASSVDGEILLFSGTGGKTGKRATGSGLVKVTSGVFGTATSGTDYAPATSGTSLLKGNGSGGFSNAASGTDYAPATSGTALLKGNGSGGFSNAASGTDYAPATSGSALLKGNGSGGFSSASSGTDYAPATSGSGILKGNGSGGFSTATAGTDYYNPGGTDVALADGGTGASTAGAARVNLQIDNYTAHGNAGATEAFSANTAWHSVTLDQNTEFTVTDWPSTGAARSIVLEILQDATGGRTIDWSGITGSAPTISAAANSVTIVQLSTRDGGTTVYATSTTDGGDFSSDTASSVDGEVVLFSGTAGKTGKRATGSGLAKLTSGVLSTATSGTDYAPATSGTSLLKGSGSGGFSNATSGTDYAPATSGSSILKGNGSGGFSSATSGTDYAPATSGSALLKGNGTGGFSSAASGTDYAPATSGSGILKGNGSGGFSTATAGTDYLTKGTLEHEKTLTLDNIADSMDYVVFFTRVAITVTHIRGVHFGSGLSSPSIVITVRHGTDKTSGTTVEAVTVTSSTSGTADDGTLSDATIPANSWVWITTSSKSGTTDDMAVSITYTHD
jgi:hypothetical protein